MNIDIHTGDTLPEIFEELGIFAFFVHNNALHCKVNDKGTLNTIRLSATGPHLTSCPFDMCAFTVVPHERLSIKVVL